MWVVVAFAIMPVLGFLLAALFVAGEDPSRSAKRTRLLIFAGRIAAALVLLECLGLLWIARGSLAELHFALSVVGVVTLFSAAFVFRRAPSRIRAVLVACGLALTLGALGLKGFKQGGWVGLAQEFGWVALLLGAGYAIGFAILHFAKYRERNDVRRRSLKDSTIS